jgi:hypothetical protein
MTIVLKDLWGHVQRDWGYEIRADFLYGPKILNEVLIFKAKPDQKQIDTAVSATLSRLESEASIPDKTETVEVPPDQVKVDLYSKLCALCVELDTVDEKMGDKLRDAIDPLYHSMSAAEVKMSNETDRPEYVKCISGKDGGSLCGKYEDDTWRFVSLEHAEAELAGGGRLIPCAECLVIARGGK